jgi:hypothetical protein
LQSISAGTSSIFLAKLRSLSLFDKVEGALIGKTFKDENEFFQCVMDVPNGISPGEIKAVVEEWLVRFDACIGQVGDYLE